MGSKKNPVWRVVVADQRSPRDGRIIESIGHYNPQTEPSTIVIDRERLDHWIEKGAQPTNTIRKLMRAENTPARSARAVASPELDAAEAPTEVSPPEPAIAAGVSAESGTGTEAAADPAGAEAAEVAPDEAAPDADPDAAEAQSAEAPDEPAPGGEPAGA